MLGTIEILILLIFFVPTVIALVDITKSEFTGNHKIFWIFIVILLNLIGVIFYGLMGRKQKVG